jgi:hypothetical protein
MVKINLVVREPAKFKPDYFLDFELPEVPSIGSYISIHRPDKPEPYGEDVVVKKVWWRLEHPEIMGSHHADAGKIGSLIEIFVECDIALGPYASDAWREWAAGAKARGATVDKFEVARASITEAELKKLRDENPTG